MTRARQLTQAGSAPRKARTAPSSSSKPESMPLLIDEGNVGAYHRRIVADGEDRLDAERWLDEGGSVIGEAVTR